MSNPYELTSSPDRLSYQFTTDSGDKYTAYFTVFYLQNEQGEDLEISSFGFERLKGELDAGSKFDPRVKVTILHILLGFFKMHSEDAVLYICFPGDGKARNRRITFSRWFNELASDFIKHDSRAKYGELNFYSSLIVAKNNPRKDEIIQAFHHTISYWMDE